MVNSIGHQTVTLSCLGKQFLEKLVITSIIDRIFVVTKIVQTDWANRDRIRLITTPNGEFAQKESCTRKNKKVGGTKRSLSLSIGGWSITTSGFPKSKNQNVIRI